MDEIQEWLFGDLFILKYANLLIFLLDLFVSTKFIKNSLYFTIYLKKK